MTEIQKDQAAYFNQRMKELGVTEENNKITLFNPEAEPPMPKLFDTKIFWYDREGNITIKYYTIDGEIIIYYNDKAKNPKPLDYFTTRLREPKGDMKYKMPYGEKPKPWFHPITMKAFKEKEKIEILYLTEGVFKSWAAGQVGLHVVGLSSITHYADGEGSLHRDIVRLIETCDVDKVCVLWDGDCLNVSLKDIKRREEASRRPYGFYNAARKIRKLVLKAEYSKTRSNPRIYFAHIRSETLDGSPKGLDDFLIAAEQQGKLRKVLGDLKRLDDKGPYFYRNEITTTTDTLFKYFALDKSDPEKFYNRHSIIIGEEDFYFRDNHYKYDEADNELRMLQPGWAKTIYWVGDDFYEEIEVPSAAAGLNQRELVGRKKETLSARHGKSFVNFLKYYYAFVNVPNHFDYERIIEIDNKEFLNKYFPFPHIPEKGNWPNIENFLKHIFSERIVVHPKTQQEIPNWHLALDYLQLLLMNPTQLLPILILYSPENQTGKSTFGELCYKIFGDNVIFISNSDLQSDFNEVYAGRLMAICEETSLDRKRDSERIKNLSTATRLTVNGKFKSQYAIDFFCKFIFMSNNARMVYLTRHDDRYWINQVKAIPKDKLDPDLKERMWEEIPAFVHYLKNRTLITSRESRMHFNPELLKTEIFNKTVQVNEPTAATNLRIGIADMFYDFPDLKEIEMPLKNIIEEFNFNKNDKSWVMEILKDYLRVDLLRDEAGNQIQKRGEYQKTVYNQYAGENGDLETQTIKWRGRPYIFKREDFVLQEAVEA